MVETPFHTKTEGLWADVYVQKELKWEKVRAACRIVERPFFKPARRTATPPADR
jgi:aminomethyltransferase